MKIDDRRTRVGSPQDTEVWEWTQPSSWNGRNVVTFKRGPDDRSSDPDRNDVADQGHFPFGEAWYLGAAGTKWQFTTHERDAESGRPPSGCLNLWPLHG